MENMQYQASIFKALADEKRIGILHLLARGEKCACHLFEAMNMAQSTLAYHMKILCDSNLVDSRQEGKWTHYRISETGTRQAVDVLTSITQASKQADLDRLTSEIDSLGEESK